MSVEDDFVYADCTHLLNCKHCIGKRCMYYTMNCIPLGKTKGGLMKVIVFGERNWKGKEHIKRVRYVQSDRVFQRNINQVNTIKI